MDDEFYVGWEDRAPAATARRVRWVVLSLGLLILMLGIAFGCAQRTILVSVFEWGKIKEFSGILRLEPYPHLLVGRPGTDGDPTQFSSYCLVKPFKFGLDRESLREFDGLFISLKGTLIYRESQTMIEVVADSIKPSPAPGESRDARKLPSAVPMGRQTLVGEIVDSKCYLGVMNPGRSIPHRGCAIRCISGGVPPIFLVRQSDGKMVHYLLVSVTGSGVNKEVLNLVGESVQITGQVERLGDLLVLRADPATYKRL
jgi:hypothetical protein